MSLNLSIKTRIFAKNLLKKRVIFLFFIFFKVDFQELTKFKIFLKDHNLKILIIPTKQINRILNHTCANDVVKNNFKKYELNIINLSLLEFENFFSLIFILFYFLDNLFLKVNNLFLSVFFIRKLFLKSQFSNVLQNNNNIEFSLVVNTMYLAGLNMFVFVKLNFFKLIFFFKFLLNLKFFEEFYKYI